jgi:uncharacterized repeat protein (TIGR01451 family)
MKKALLLVIVALMFIPVAAFADNPLDSQYSPNRVVITAEGFQNVLRYTDTGNATKDAIMTSTIEVKVDPMYGFDALANLTDLNKTTPTIPLTYVYLITNEGNATDTIRVRMNITLVSGANWTYKVTEEGNATSIVTANGTWGNLTALGEDSTRLIYLTVTPSILQSESSNGAYAVVTLEANTQSTPAGVYYGANGFVYGGTFEATDLTITSIETSVMNMTRVATVDAPKGATGKFTGDAHAAVPGAVITYTITVSNEGGSDAKNVSIVDKVPPVNTTAAHVGATASEIGTNVTITAAGDNAIGWTAYFSSIASPNLTAFGPGTDWTTIGATPVTRTLTLDANVSYVKWEKVTVQPTEDAKTLTWGVTIR